MAAKHTETAGRLALLTVRPSGLEHTLDDQLHPEASSPEVRVTPGTPDLTPQPDVPAVSHTSEPTIGRRTALGTASVLGVGVLLAVLYKAEPASNQAAIPADVRLNHLLRRAGFGATPSELQTYQQHGLAGTTNQLLNYETIPNTQVDGLQQQFNLDFAKGNDLQRWWMLRMLYTTHPLEERMVLFWHSLLTSALSKVQSDMMYVQNDFFRENAFASFDTLLKGVSKDPAMMVWLDLQTNRKGHANENFARELMELFSMGVGNYTEQDVRESSRAFTGYGLGYHGKYVAGVFNPPFYSFAIGAHDNGPKTFLGQTGNFTGDDIIDIIVKQPITAEYFCKRLFSFFAYDDPEPAVLASLTKTYFASNYSTKAIVQQILTSEAFYSARAYRAIVKSPVDYVIGSARAFDMVTDGKTLPGPMPAMGQTLLNPPNVAGWPGGTSWLNSGTWLARLNVANAMVAAPKGSFRDAGSFEQWLKNQAGSTVAGAADFLVTHLMDGQIGSAQHQALLDFGNTATGPEPERLRGMAYLALAMPEHHLS